MDRVVGILQRLFCSKKMMLNANTKFIKHYFLNINIGRIW